MQNEFDYRKYLGLLNKHKRLFAVVALIIMTGAVVITYLLPKKYQARSVVFVERNVLNDLVRGIAVTPSMEDMLRGLNSTIKSRTLLTKVINDLDLNLKKQGDVKLEETILDLQKRTDFHLNDKEGLITITFIDKNPRLARDYVNTLVRRYIEENLSSKRDESYGATSFLSEQIASTKDKLDKVEAEINKLRMESGASLVVDPASIHTEINAGLQRLDELILRRTQLETTRNQLRKNDPAMNKVLALQKRLEELRVEYTDNYPEVLKVKADIEAAQREIRGSSKGSAPALSDSQEVERVEAELRALRISEVNQRAILANSRGLLHGNPGARSELQKLEQEKNAYRTQYDQLAARLGQAEVSKQLGVQDKTMTFRIIEPAVIPVIPISPNRVRIILMGIAAGLAGGGGLLLVIDNLDKSVKTVDAVRVLGIQILAVIPKIVDPQEVKKESSRSLRLYLAAGAYFSMIVALLALEALNLSPVERIIGMIQG